MSNDIIWQIALTALVGALQQGCQHYFPWGLVFRRELPRVLAYTTGTLAYLIPLTVLFLYWDRAGYTGQYAHLIALWACVIASELAVVVCRGMDWALDRIQRSYEHEELSNATTRPVK